MAQITINEIIFDHEETTWEERTKKILEVAKAAGVNPASRIFHTDPIEWGYEAYFMDEVLDEIMAVTPPNIKYWNGGFGELVFFDDEDEAEGDLLEPTVVNYEVTTRNRGTEGPKENGMRVINWDSDTSYQDRLQLVVDYFAKVHKHQVELKGPSAVEAIDDLVDNTLREVTGKYAIQDECGVWLSEWQPIDIVVEVNDEDGGLSLGETADQLQDYLYEKFDVDTSPIDTESFEDAEEAEEAIGLLLERISQKLPTGKAVAEMPDGNYWLINM